MFGPAHDSALDSSRGWVQLVTLCAPNWDAYVRGDMGRVQLGQQVRTFFALARVNRDLRHAHETVCHAYFGQHCCVQPSQGDESRQVAAQDVGQGPDRVIKSSKHATWAQALARVFQVLVYGHHASSGKLLTAGVSLSVCRQLNQLNLKNCCSDTYELCAKLFARQLSHLVPDVLDELGMKKIIKCLPLLVQHQFTDCVPSLFSFFAGMTDEEAVDWFDTHTWFHTLMLLDEVVAASPAASQHLVSFVTKAGPKVLLGLVAAYFLDVRIGATVLALLRTPALWDMWTEHSWWLTIARDGDAETNSDDDDDDNNDEPPRGKANPFVMAKLAKHCPRLVELVLPDNHSIVGEHLPTRLALNIPGWQCRATGPNGQPLSYKQAVIDALNTGDADSLDLLVQRGLSLQACGNACVSSWVQSYKQCVPVRAQVRALERMFHHGCRLKFRDIGLWMQKLPAELCLALLLHIRDTGSEAEGLWNPL